MIYYYHSDDIPLFLLTVYAKAHKSTLTPAEKAQLRGLAKRIVEHYRKDS